MEIKNIFLHNIGIKFLALCLAVLSWFYIIGEIKKEMYQLIPKQEVIKSEETRGDNKVVTKIVPVYPKIKGRPQEGYKLTEEQISISPPTVTLRGSPEVLDKISFVSTESINVNGKTQAVAKKVSLAGLPEGVDVQPKKDIEVAIPIEKIKR